MEDHLIAERYGWTLTYIDTLTPDDRNRIHFMWAVSTVHSMAMQYVDEWEKKQNALAETIGNIRSGRVQLRPRIEAP